MLRRPFKKVTKTARKSYEDSTLFKKKVTKGERKSMKLPSKSYEKLSRCHLNWKRFIKKLRWQIKKVTKTSKKLRRLSEKVTKTLRKSYEYSQKSYEHNVKKLRRACKKLRRGSPATFFETFAVHCCVFVTFLASLRNFFCEDDPRKLRTRPCKKRTKSKALPPQKSYEELCQKLRKALAFLFEWKTLHKKVTKTAQNRDDHETSKPRAARKKLRRVFVTFFSGFFVTFFRSDEDSHKKLRRLSKKLRRLSKKVTKTPVEIKVSSKKLRKRFQKSYEEAWIKEKSYEERFM